MDGVEATRAILAENPAISIVVLTSFSDRHRVLAALDAGAIGYQLKDAETETLLARDTQRRRRPRPTRSESGKQIARKLGISESTVKSHLSRVFQTIGVHDRTQAALWVQRRKERG